MGAACLLVIDLDKRHFQVCGTGAMIVSPVIL